MAPDDPPHDSTFVFDYDSERLARTVARSVAREVGEIASDRSRATVLRDGRTVTVRVDARDLTALRAAGNTWLSLLGVAEDAAALGERVRSR